MLNFVFILTIFLEIILTLIIVLKTVQLEKKIISYNEKLNLTGEIIIKICKTTRATVANVNKFVRIITNKNLIQTLRIIRITVDTIQIIILLKSLSLSKGFKSINFKNIKKVLLSEVIRRFLRRFVFKRVLT